MSDFSEVTVQYGIARRLEELGWAFHEDESLGRPFDLEKGLS